MSPSEPGSPGAHDAIEHIVASCSADDRVTAVFLGGSLARGNADGFSDLDLCVIVADHAYAEVVAGRETFVRAIGDPLFLEDFGGETTFVILADGTELELTFVRERDVHAIRSGPHRVLVDKADILAGAAFPVPEPDPAAQVEELRRILFWFWHDVGHFTTAIGRHRLWWAAGQLEQLRAYCVNLVRIDQGVQAQDEAFWKLDDEISVEPLAPLRSTFVELERDLMLRAGREVVGFFRERAPAVAEAYGTLYPAALAELVSGHLDDLDPEPR
jgi:predicted nucleotidyltransferase